MAHNTLERLCPYSRLVPARRNHHWRGASTPPGKTFTFVYRVVWNGKDKEMGNTTAPVFEEMRRNVAGIDLAWRTETYVCGPRREDGEF